MAKFSRNGPERRSAIPVFGVPPPEIAVPPPKVVVPTPANLQLNFEVLNITANSLLQNGFVFMVHTVFFGQLIFRKIIKIVATRCQILTLKCTKFVFGCGSAPDPAGGAYIAPPDPLAAFKGAYF